MVIWSMLLQLCCYYVFDVIRIADLVRGVFYRQTDLGMHALYAFPNLPIRHIEIYTLCRWIFAKVTRKTNIWFM